MKNHYPKMPPEQKVYIPYYRKPETKEICNQRLVRRVNAKTRAELINEVTSTTNLWKSTFPNFGVLPRLSNIENRRFAKMKNIKALPNKYIYNDYHSKNTNPGYSVNFDGKHFTS